MISPQTLGLTPAQWKEIQDHLVAPLLAQQATLWAFGSRARGDHQPHSDLDIMVDGPHDLSSAIAAVREYFEQSNFPFKIDLAQKSQFAVSYLPGFEKDKKKLAGQ